MAVFHRDDAFFVDLYVRTDNYLAVSLYNKLKYSVYRHILEFYSANYDAYGILLFDEIIDRYAQSTSSR